MSAIPSPRPEPIRRFPRLGLALLVPLLALPPAVATPQTEPPQAPADSVATAPPPARTAQRPSLILYVADGLGARELPAFKYPLMTAPGMVRMMEEGVTFTAIHTVSPWTVPAMASLLTSLYPSAHGVQKAGDRLPASAKTLAEVLKENGYQTALFSAHPLVGRLSGLDQGFDQVEEVPGPFGLPARKGPGQTSVRLNERLLGWLDRRAPGAPVFVVVLSADPMEPYGAPSPVGDSFISGPEREWYLEARRRLMAARPGPLGLATSGDLKRLKIDPDRFARAARGIYDGAILHNDQRMADLRRELESRDLWKKSLFAVTATHGVEFGEWGMFGHGMSLYDTSIRVPLVITYPPGVPRASQMRRACDTVDLMPTLLSMLGLPIPEGVQGIPRNIEPTSPETVGLYDRPAFAETSPAGALPTGTASMVAESAVKLILYQEPAAGIEKPEMELFRLPDPVGWEKRNMVPFLPQIASKYREILDGWRASKGKLVLPPDASPAASPRQLPEILRSLGYLQGSSPAPVSGTGSR